MYAQYQTYQQPNQPMTSQSAMTWDSKRGGWIPSGGGAVASSTYSTYNSSSSYQQQQQQQQPSMKPPQYQQQQQQQQQQQIIPPNPVQTYTDYYHGWLAHGKECEEYLRRLVDQNQRSETQRRIDWAKYYADEASRAAHHFYSNPQATSAPFDLPPAPPAQTNQQQHPAATQAPSAVGPQQQVNNTYQQQQQQQQQQPNRNNINPPSSTTTTTTTTTTTSSNDENTPGGLTRYVKRCLDQCSTDQQRKAVQAEVEKVIAEAIQNGNLHTRNWESVTLIPVPQQQQQHISFSIAPQHNNNNNRRLHQNKNNNSNVHNNSFFNNNRSGGSGGGGGGKYSRRYDDKLPENDSYYGHHGGGSNNNNNNNGRPTSNKNSSPSGRKYDEKLPQNDSYYGNSSGGGGATTPNNNNNNHNDSRFGRQRSPPMNDNRRGGNGGGGGQSDNYYGPASSSYSPNNTNMASSYAEDSSSPLSSQKRSVVTPEEDFISFQQSRRNKKQKKSGKGNGNGNGNGFERSTHALAKRANRFSGPGGIYEASSSSSVKNNGGHDQYMGKKLIGGSNKVLDEEDFQKMTVKGTCLKLEKEYLRLTAPPKAELVRPQPILERHLDNLKKDYAAKKRDYLWFCSQFKAMRQDCTVQRIQSGFAVDVYETHARIALQEGDLNEYNQCQTQLKELYESGYTMGNESEFIAYRLLYYCFLSTNEKYDGGSSDMFKILLQLTSEQKMDPAIAHALKTREALAFGDYIQFFRLHKDSPGLSRYLSDRIVPTMRMRGLRRMVKGYRPSLDVDVFKDQLGFDSMEGCTKFLTSCGCVIEGSNCITKDSNNIHEPVEEKKNSLI